MSSSPGSQIQSSHIQIRLAAPEHLNVLVVFNIAMAKETEDKELDETLVRPGVAAVLERKDLGFYVVAEYQGRAVGQLLITYEWSDWRNAVFWWVQSVYVSPEYRRMGIYRALHGYVALQSRRQGDVCGLRLYVDKDNKVAQQVYSSLKMRQARYDLYEIEFDLESDDSPEERNAAR